MGVYYLGVEIGGTKQQIAIGSSDGKIIERISEQVILSQGALSIRSWLTKEIPGLLKKYTSKNNFVKCACVGFGGPIETETGKVLLSVQVPGWEDFELRNWFESEFHIPAYILNDTVAGGYAELLIGAGKGSKSFFYTNIGTGIGGAFFIDGKYYDGTGFGAAYLGNTYIPDMLSGRPGEKIRLEDICSGPATEKRLRTEGYVDRDSLLMEMCHGDISQLTCRMLGDAARSGDAFAVKEIQFYSKAYAVGLGNIMTSISPDVVVIGGGVSNLGETLIGPIREAVSKTVFVSLKNRYHIYQSKLCDDNVLVGAILYAAGSDGTTGNQQ